MKQSFSFLLLIFLFSFTIQTKAQQLEKVLPKGTSDEEKSLISDFQFKSNTASSAPSSPVRTAAEWEEIEYLVIRWTNSFQNILLQIVEAAVQECKVLITTQNQSLVSSYLSSNGIDMSQVEFLDTPSNSIWIRDYAGNTVYTNDVGDLALVDWIYNRPRPDDNEMPVAHANFTNVPLFRTNSGTDDLVNTGGNFMSDGMGTAFASKLILEENQVGNPYGVTSKTASEIDDIMFEYQGITNYIKFDQTPFDPIDHIDMHMKLLDEQTILVSKYPDGIADGPQIEANINYLTSNFQTPFGTDYKIEWIDAPPSTSGLYPDTGGYYRTYTNSVFVNETVIVPTYRPEVDVDALALYEELLPGYNIVGIDVDNSEELLIALSGAIHCITHSIGVSDPLLIIHEPVEEANTNLAIPVNASIKHNSDISEAKVFWRETGDTDFEETPMSFNTDDNWATTLSVPSSASTIEYYIWAEANSGKTMTRPMVAPEGFWTFDIANLSLEDWAEKNIIGPYPNPAKNKVSFKLKAISGEVDIEVHNLQGQKLFENTIQNADGKITLNLKPEWSGTLLVSFSGEFGRIIKKVIKI
ncbi:agmatine deiminase family protein [Psychroflexus planctonicus]|uniref:agmatine deiminase family protein n=1 Tax=Psychroflexus planctonicus TaxID=1526575 RepID=UPI00166E6E4A|nr:agmatine deiminase family protein [Psychroflexus planctonicus]